MFLTLYRSVIRPILDNRNRKWSPIFKRQSVILENVQRRATRLLPELECISYENRLKILKLPSLKYRRMRGDLIQLFKIIHGIDNISYEDFFNFSHITFTRGDRYKIFIKRCKSSIRQNSFIFRIVHIWNNLKYDTKSSDSINKFKNAIDRELFTLMYEFDE